MPGFGGYEMGDRGLNTPVLALMAENGAETEMGQEELPESGAALPADVQDHIGRHLRALYDEVMQAPIPDRFLKLLEELERKQAERK